MTGIKYSPKALHDLQNIKDYVTNEFSSEELSISVLKRITSLIRQLEIFPMAGQSLSTLINIHTDYYYLFCEKNYVFYRIEKDVIRIVRILNERQDYMRILFGISIVSDDEE